MSVPRTTTLTWRKSSHSGVAGGNCIEVSDDLLGAGIVPVRDSKDPEGPQLAFSPAAWTAFAQAAATGTLISA